MIIYLNLALIIISTCLLSCRPNSGERLIWSAINASSVESQGDAHLLTFCKTNHILIDTGPAVNSENLISYLKKNNCAMIQSVIITHAHRDHYGGLPPMLAAGIKVKSVFFNIPCPDLVAAEPWGCSAGEISAITNGLQQAGIPLKDIRAGTRWAMGTEGMLSVICAYDGIHSPVGRTDLNDTSAVLMLRHGRNRFLFAADLNRAVGGFLTTNCPGRLKADVLKFPHHGAESFPNESFFAVVNAKTFIVPAPVELWFSDRSARARKLTEGRAVFINGICGDITVISDGKGFQVHSDKGNLR